MVRQVRLNEKYVSATTGALINRPQPVFAFGTHPNVTSDDEAHPVTSANAGGNKLRVIMDELLVGNYLEEIGCRGQVDSDNYASVPEGATPDDIARCSVAKDVLPASCPASNAKAVCICQIDGGCGETAKGMPVGVKDENMDGAADAIRLIDGSVGLKCGSINVPIDVNKSYWNPSGDQNVPAVGGFDALGPAIIVIPSSTIVGVDPFLPTNADCSLVFADNVVDKQHNKVCTPENGDITKDCTPGDMSKFSFKVEPLAPSYFMSGPVTIKNMATGVSRTEVLSITMTAPIDAASLSNISVMQGSTPYTNFTVALGASPVVINITWTGGLAATTTYTVNVGSGVSDSFKQPMPTPTAFTFTTGA